MAGKVEIQEPIGLIELLSINCLKPCVKLLQDNGYPKPKNYGHMQEMLADLYVKTDDKRAMEQAMADMHPHKDFILKYSSVKPQAEEIKVQPVQKVPARTQIVANDWAGDEGNRQYANQQYLNACGCGCSGHSGFDGTGGPRKMHASGTNTELIVVSVLAMVAIVGLCLHHAKLLPKLTP